MTVKSNLPTRRSIVTAIVSISAMLFMSTLAVGNVDARKMGTYICEHIPGSGTIGQVECCAPDLDTADIWCTTCDNTQPPSNCGPAEQQYLKNDDIPNPNTGGVYTPDESESSDSTNDIDNDNVPTGGTFSEDDSGSSTSDDSRANIDQGEVNSGGVFNQ
jgi:hypothetical protein